MRFRSERLVLGLAMLVCGCGARSAPIVSIGKTEQKPLPSAEPLLPHGADDVPDLLPNDVFYMVPKGEYLRNTSLDDREQAAADKILASVSVRVKKAASEDLLAGLRDGYPANNVEYRVWRQGNEMIEEELRRRGDAAKPAAEKFLNDRRGLWTGYNGPGGSVHDLCMQLLGREDD